MTDGVTRLAAATEALAERVRPHGRTGTVSLEEAVGERVAADVHAERAVPEYERVATEGFAVRAADTHPAGRAPVDLRRAGTGGTVGSQEAARVRAGSPLPDGADAVVRAEDTRAGDDRVTVERPVTAGEHVTPVGADVAADRRLFPAGHRLTPPDVGLLRAAGHRQVPVVDPPRVSVVPAGEQPVTADPDPGGVTETGGLVVSRLVERWGGWGTSRGVVTDDEGGLAAAVEGDTDHDLVATVGGRDRPFEMVDEHGAVVVDGLAVEPGRPGGVGVVDGTVVLLLPGDAVACLVVATVLLRPAVGFAGGFDQPAFHTTRATLARKIHSAPGRRTFARVRLDDEEAVPTRTGGADVLSSVTSSDGWVVVPEAAEGFQAGAEVTVEHWHR